MYPFAKTLALGLPKALSQSSRRNLHHLSPAASFYLKSNHLLKPTSTSTHSVRWLSEEIVAAEATASTTNVLTHNELVLAVQEKLMAFHDVSGLPWWAVIVTSTIVVRSILILPVAAHQQYIFSRLSTVDTDMNTTVKKEVTDLVSRLAAEHDWNEKTSGRRYRQLMRERRLQLYRKYNCHPMKNVFLVFVQLPVWVTMSSAFRNISSMLPIPDGVAERAYLQMKADGFWILKDLTVPDGTYAIPVLIVVTNLTIIQLNEMCRLRKRNLFRTSLIMLMRLFSLVSLPFVVHMPKCMTLYWLTSSLYGLCQNILFLHPRTRRMLRIPHYEYLRKEPFVHVKNRLKSIYYFFKY